jgi:antitoxin (DNA-binding transcriptional repressor) of toxin-antitoxin stability system
MADVAIRSADATIEGVGFGSGAALNAWWATAVASYHVTMYDDHSHMPLNQVSKANFKARALEIFRRVQETGEAVLITDRGRPVLRLEPYFGEDDAVLASLRDSVVCYRDPTEPVGEDAWEAVS